jgi:hypothetical protein
MKYTVFCILILAFAVLPSCRFFGNKSDEAAILKAKQDSIRVADSIKNVQMKLAESARLDSIKKAEQAKMEYEAKFKFNIIVGSFVTPQYARNFLAEIAKKGYTAKLLKLEGTQFEMVSAEVHDSYKSALDRLQHFKDSGIEDPWVYVAPGK